MWTQARLSLSLIFFYLTVIKREGREERSAKEAQVSEREEAVRKTETNLVNQKSECPDVAQK